MKTLLCALLALTFAAPAPPPQDPQGTDALTEALAAQGITLDLAIGVCAIPVAIEVRDDLLEYLLVLPHGAAHETLFLADLESRDLERATIFAQSLNAALLALGVEPGTNARWIEKDPPPVKEEVRQGVSPYDVLPPEGDGFHLYAAWREGDELYFYPCEDLVRDLSRQRTMRRHRWVYLGSRIVQRRSGEEAFAAGLEGNLVNISFFSQGNTLITGALEECLSQSSWLPNAWLLPPRGSRVTLLFSRERLATLPDALAAIVPSVQGGER